MLSCSTEKRGWTLRHTTMGSRRNVALSTRWGSRRPAAVFSSPLWSLASRQPEDARSKTSWRPPRFRFDTLVEVGNSAGWVVRRYALCADRHRHRRAVRCLEEGRQPIVRGSRDTQVNSRSTDSLPSLVALVERELGPEAIERGVFWRDGIGRLSFVTRMEISPETSAAFVAAANGKPRAIRRRGAAPKTRRCRRAGTLRTPGSVGNACRGWRPNRPARRAPHRWAGLAHTAWYEYETRLAARGYILECQQGWRRAHHCFWRWLPPTLPAEVRPSLPSTSTLKLLDWDCPAWRTHLRSGARST